LYPTMFEVELAVHERTTSWVPVPVRLAVSGLPLELSETVRLAVRIPIADGENNTTIVQLAPTARELPQLLFCVKSVEFAPVTATPEMLSATLPVLLKVIVRPVLIMATGWLKKFTLLGDRLAPAELIVPLRLTVCGLPAAPSMMEMVAVRVPAAVGVNTTLIAQLAPAPTLDPQLLV